MERRLSRIELLEFDSTCSNRKWFQAAIDCAPIPVAMPLHRVTEVAASPESGQEYSLSERRAQSGPGTVHATNLDIALNADAPGDRIGETKSSARARLPRASRGGLGARGDCGSEAVADSGVCGFVPTVRLYWYGLGHYCAPNLFHVKHPMRSLHWPEGGRGPRRPQCFTSNTPGLLLPRPTTSPARRRAPGAALPSRSE